MVFASKYRIFKDQFARLRAPGRIERRAIAASQAAGRKVLFFEHFLAASNPRSFHVISPLASYRVSNPGYFESSPVTTRARRRVWISRIRR